MNTCIFNINSENNTQNILFYHRETLEFAKEKHI